MHKIKTLVITGPTATGKTALGVSLAAKFGGEIISADSRQVYRGLDIGTGKDLSEYSNNEQIINYHLIDILDPSKTYNLRQFNHDAFDKINEIRNKQKLPIIVGGSPLYIDSLISSYKFPLPPPDESLRTHLKEKSAEEIANYLKEHYTQKYDRLENKLSRPRLIRILEEAESRKNGILQSLEMECDFLILAPYYERDEVHKRIELRLDQRLKSGMIEEVEKLHNAGLSWEKLDSFGLEYRYVSKYLKNELSCSEMRNTLLAKIRQFARSQDVWFRKMEKEGHKIYWIPKGDIVKAMELVLLFLEGKHLSEPKIRISEIFYGKKQKN